MNTLTATPRPAVRGPLILDKAATAEWVPEELRNRVLVCNEGIVVVSDSHFAHGEVSSVVSNIRRYWKFYEDTLRLPFEQILNLNSDSGPKVHADSHTIQFARDLINDAFGQHASDIHIAVHQLRNFGEVHFRIDGRKTHQERYKREAAELEGLCNVLYGVMPDVGASHRNPSVYQAARIGYETGHLPKGLHGLRVESGPILGGSSMTLRLLYDDTLVEGTLEDRLKWAGYSPRQRRMVAELAEYPNGITLMSGPTGSGKTTTLFAIMTTISKSKPHLNLMTVEDPPELTIMGAQQIPVNTGDSAAERGEAFARAMRHTLRMDPDVIMIGELRDAESTHLCAEASQTGHQVWATVHANSAWKSVSRVLELLSGERYAETRPAMTNPDIVRGLMAQRLIRRLCPHCSVPFMGNEGKLERSRVERVLHAIEALGGDAKCIRIRGPGCAHCSTQPDRHGYRGRTAVAEVVLPGEELMTQARAHGVLGAERAWLSNGGVNMMKHALIKLTSGDIDAVSLEEVLGHIDTNHMTRLTRAELQEATDHAR